MEPGKPYPSDVNRVQFELIRPLLEGVRKRTKPRTVDLYEVFNAVLYLLKSGCQWSILPEGFPNWRTVHSYFAKWSAADQDGVSVLERALKKSVGETREKLGRNAMTGFLIVDAQSVKNTGSAEQKGCDAGKKVSGISRHIAVDTQGMPYTIAVDHGRGDGQQRRVGCHRPVQAKSGVGRERVGRWRLYGRTLADGVMERLKATVQVVKRNELHTFAVLPKRWVVECSFGWLEKCRRPWKNCERKLNTSLQMIHLAFLRLLLRRS
jgi:transposase